MKKYPPRSIFISYNHDESRNIAGRIYERLASRLTPAAVFKDDENATRRLGFDFRTTFEAALKDCRVVLVVIDPSWYERRMLSEKQGDDMPPDWVRIEVESALNTPGLAVIPLMVDGADFPKNKPLPATMTNLRYRDGKRIPSDEGFGSSMDDLVRHLEALLVDRPSAKPSRPSPSFFALFGTAMVLGMGAWGLWKMADKHATPPDKHSSEPNDKLPEPAISSKLRAWLDDPKVNRKVAQVFAAKGNGYYQNGLQELITGTESVAGRRMHQLSWEANEKPVHAYNGIGMDIVVKGVDSPLSKTVGAVLYFVAERAGDPSAAAESIKVDPNITIGSAPISGNELDAPPGFSHFNVSGGALTDVWGHPTFSPQFFAGSEGVIPAGTHRVAMELIVDNQPIYRGVFDLVAPPLIYAQPREQWIKDVATPKLDVALVPNSVSRPTVDSLQWRVLMKGDINQLDDPMAIQCHYLANGLETGNQDQWIVDDSREMRAGRSKEIEGMNHWEFSWGTALTDWKDGSCEQAFILHCGPRGKFTAGLHEVALEVLSRGKPVWRGIMKLDVPAQ